MRYSILDQAPISTGMTSEVALNNSVELAKFADKLGFKRFWLAEHHSMKGLASTSPEVTLTAIGMVTENIRLGSGATLLPYYKPLKVAENYNTLASLIGDRVDIGIGRAPGGDNKVSEALSDNYLAHVFKMPELVSDLTKFINDRDPDLKAVPKPSSQPKLWMLGTSEKSATFAKEASLNYCFGAFMSDKNIGEVLDVYRQGNEEGEVILTVNVYCGESDDHAEQLAYPYLVNQVLKSSGREFPGIPSLEEVSEIELTADEKSEIDKIKQSCIIGSKESVKHAFKNLAEDYDIDEVMIVTITHDMKDKLESYKRISEI